MTRLPPPLGALIALAFYVMCLGICDAIEPDAPVAPWQPRGEVVAPNIVDGRIVGYLTAYRGTIYCETQAGFRIVGRYLREPELLQACTPESMPQFFEDAAEFLAGVNALTPTKGNDVARSSP